MAGEGPSEQSPYSEIRRPEQIHQTLEFAHEAQRVEGLGKTTDSTALRQNAKHAEIQAFDAKLAKANSSETDLPEGLGEDEQYILHAPAGDYPAKIVGRPQVQTDPNGEHYVEVTYWRVEVNPSNKDETRRIASRAWVKVSQLTKQRKA